MNFKKIVVALAAAFVAVSALAIVASVKLNGNADKSTYRGIGEGRNGPIEVEIKVAENQIKSARIVKEAESDFAKAAETKIIEQAISAKSLEKFDAVSGATITSDGTAAALRDAWNKYLGAKQEQASYSDTECDIVIVGAGGAGMTAAIEATKRGAKVILLEKMGTVGGNTNSATGGLNASETSIQKQLGIQDSNEQYYQDTMKGGREINDKSLVRTMVNNSAAIVDWLISLGADLTDVGKMAGSTNKRTHRPQGGAPVGTHLVKVLKQNLDSLGIDLRLNSKVTNVLNQDGKPAGVKVDYKGKTYSIKAKAVIIATGGFGANPKMVVQYKPNLEGFGTTNHKGATGDAFAWLEQFNAQTVDMEQIQTHPTVIPSNGFMITEAVRGNGAIMINREGKRFGNEMATRDVMSKNVLDQTGKTAWLFFDQGVRESLKAIEGYAKKGLLTEGKSVEEIAAALGLPEDALKATLDEYNAAQKSGSGDAAFGRKASEMPRALDNPPYYAVEVAPAIHHTMGGLKIDTSARVLNKNGQVIPGLFAAGEVTGGVHGANRLGGNAVADIEIFGKIAADSACEFIARP
ncbi:MAG: flavocytochrome c [Treponema sp.]|nr:flavocytochrome c [Treponema sp.]